MKILFLGDIQHANSKNWISAFEKYGNCEVVTWSLPWPEGFLGKLKRIKAWIFALRSIHDIIRSHQPDIVIGYRLTSYGFIAAISKHPVIVVAAQANSDVRSPISNNVLGTKLKKRLAVYAINNSKLIHAWSENMAKNIYELGAPQNKVLVMHRGIDLGNFTIPERGAFNSLELIVTRGLYKEYRHDIILKAVKEISIKGIPINLRIAGIGVEERKLRELSRELQLEDHVNFLGRLGNTHLREELSKSNVYVSMPVTEGLSSSLIEAMACKCIPVVSDLPANRLWIKNNENGFLVPVDSVEELAATLENIWNNKDSFFNILENNRQVVDAKFSQEANTKIFVSQYETLIKKEILCAG